MEPTISAVETVLDNGKFGKHTVKFETGLLARQAAGSVTAYLDDETMLLSATTVGKQPKDQFDFFPLTIDVEERMYAAGQIPGSFFRSEGRPGEDAILTCRLIDRPLRPTFKKGLRNEVQVVITVMALDPDHPYDVLAINAASMSTQLSGLPFSGPVGGVRMALIEGTWVCFPNHSQLEDAVFDMVVAGRVTETGDVAIMMVEAEATESTWTLVESGHQAPTEEIVATGLDAAKPFIKQLCEAQAELAKAAAKPVAEFPIFLDYEDDVYEAVEAAVKDDTAAALTIAGKQEREERLDEIKSSLLEQVGDRFEGREKEIGAAFRSLNKALVRERVLRDKIRIDGRGLADIRPLHAEVRAAYASAEAFLRVEPGLPMAGFANTVGIGPIARPGRRDRERLARALGLDPAARWVLLAMGGMPFPLPVAEWPLRPGWTWLLPDVAGSAPDRPDLCTIDGGTVDFGDLLASADAVVTKPGYGTFVEAACAGVPILYVERDDWPETPHFAAWLAGNARSARVSREQLQSGALTGALEALWRQPAPPLPEATGAGDAARWLAGRLPGAA